MDIYRLDHANLRTNRLDDMVAWYTEILGFERGWRPDFVGGGAWMYRHGEPLVHLVEVTGPMGDAGDPRLEHVAFSARGRQAFCEHLEKNGVSYEPVPVPDAGLVQINIHDPDGNHLHVDFPLEE